MINKKNVLGKTPVELGDKDAIHVAIVAVRAGKFISPGARCDINADGEAVPGARGPGVADPFRRSIAAGESFWLLLDQAEIPNVRHVWEHPTYSFNPPTKPFAPNRYLAAEAAVYGVTYEQLAAACSHVVQKDSPAPYPTPITMTALDLMKEQSEKYTMWTEWAEETGYEFENEGSACCPETVLPYCDLFYATL